MFQEKTKLQRQCETLQENVSDLKSTLASTSSDKERFFQEKLDLHQKLQNITLDKEIAVKEKLGLEDQVTNSLSWEYPISDAVVFLLR